MRHLLGYSLVIFISFLVFTGCFVRNIPSVNAVVRSYDQAKEKRINEFIKQSEIHQKLGSVCGELGALQNFELAGRDIATHGSPELYYYFRSKASLTDTRRILSQYLEKRGWHEIESLSMNYTFAYQKDDLRVVVQYGGIGDADYGITCSKKSESQR